MSTLFGQYYGKMDFKNKNILGGKNGKLKCKDCGALRYPKVELCPVCYHSKMKYFVCTIDTEENEIYTECKDWYLLKGIDINNAMRRSNIFDARYADGQHYIIRIPKNVKEFDNEIEAKKYFESKIHKKIEQIGFI